MNLRQIRKLAKDQIESALKNDYQTHGYTCQRIMHEIDTIGLQKTITKRKDILKELFRYS